MNSFNPFPKSSPQKIGLRPAAHVSLPHSVQASNYWENSGLGTSYDSSALWSGLGEFYERKHFFNEVAGEQRLKLSATLSAEESNDFAKAFFQMQSGKCSKREILDYPFMMSKVIRSRDFQTCSIPTVCLSIGETCEGDAFFMPLRDTCGCSSHVSAEHALFDSLRETIERQHLLRFWLTSVASKKLPKEYISTTLKGCPSSKLYTLLSQVGKLVAIDISHSDFPGSAILTIFGGRKNKNVKYCAGMGYCETAAQALQKSLIELWQTYRFMDRFNASQIDLEEITEPYLLHFMQQNSIETFDTLSSVIEKPQTKNKESFNLPGLQNALNSKGLTGYFYLKQMEEGGETLYFSKFTSPNLFMHMNNSRNINLENLFSTDFLAQAIDERVFNMVPFP